jgi:hypothetical protein
MPGDNLLNTTSDLHTPSDVVAALLAATAQDDKEELNRIELLVRGALGAALLRRLDQTTELLTELIDQHGFEAAGRAVKMLCEVPESAVRVSLDSTAKLAMNFPSGPAPDETVRAATATAGELLAGVITRNTLRYTTALREMNRQRAWVPVLRELTRYVAAFIETASVASADAIDAIDMLRPQSEPPYPPPADTVAGMTTVQDEAVEPGPEPGLASKDSDVRAQIHALLPTATWQRAPGVPPGAAEPEIAEVIVGGVTYTVMRNSAEPEGEYLVYTPLEWQKFREGIGDGDFADLA